MPNAARLELSSGPRSSPLWEHCVVFLVKICYSFFTPLHEGIQMGIGEFNAAGNPAKHPTQERDQILLVGPCY